MISKLVEILNNKSVLILGFGKEGISTYRLISKHIPTSQIAIADQNEALLKNINLDIDPDVKLYLGNEYLDNLNEYDLIIKAPGISKKILIGRVDEKKIISQTDLFLKLFSKQIIGITGTKGKSTTASLIKHILSTFSKNVIFVGNIGIPPFDLAEEIDEDTWIVFELSSHQLQDVSTSPYIAVLLNLFEEHLDHYNNLKEYHLAKLNITKYQNDDDWCVMNGDDPIIKELIDRLDPQSNKLFYSLIKKINKGAFLVKDEIIKFLLLNHESTFDVSERQSLAGDHNLLNIMAAICVSKIIEIPDDTINVAIKSFVGLRHRMEYLGKFKGIHFYNDSIATIPEATISAIKTLKKVDTLILGGKDRGVDYQRLIDFLLNSGISNLVFSGDAGKRIMNDLKADGNLKSQKLFLIQNFNELPKIILENTLADHICLLSPAAASYDMFRNFEDRGEVFKKIAENL